MKPLSVIPRHQSGIGLVEILVSLLVLAIGILGFAGLQLRALNSTGESHYRSQAMAIAQDLTERVAVNNLVPARYANPNNWPTSPVKTGALPQSCVGAGNNCSANNIADWDIDQISWQAGHLLPDGRALMRACNGSAATCIIVSWNEQDPDSCEGNNGAVFGLDCVVLEVIL